MIHDEAVCNRCGKKVKYYDSVQRIVRGKYGIVQWVKVRRFRCSYCGEIHRNLPDYVFPYKQYDADIIVGVLEGFITPEVIGFEDYPCEMTMVRWKTQDLPLLL